MARNTKTEAIAELMLEVAQCFFRIRAAGQRTGLITSWGGGAFGFMRSLALLGPLTVPQIAETRPTSRQRMQRLADELAADGLVEFVDNPKHRRSKLVKLTRKGAARYRDMSASFLAIASTIGATSSETEIRKTTAVVRHLSDDVTVRLSSADAGQMAACGGGHEPAAARKYDSPSANIRITRAQRASSDRILRLRTRR